LKADQSRGHGRASIELGTAASPETVFQLASMTKQFTAAGIMLLVEDGKIRLDNQPQMNADERRLR
jgi:CubicO group peptidase (beta-lactamase class C family)